MNRFYHAVRRPVRRPGAEGYLLVTLLMFALSVSLTRLFLELAGYPQLGGGSLHIAHVLWGGLLLFLAAMLPLILSNRWIYQLGAALTGIGVGLFIDEVGKFITQENDYFYPPAAPIIYAFFLMTVMVYLQSRRRGPRRARSELYSALEFMEEILDHDLDSLELEEIDARLSFVADQKEQVELARLARSLLVFVREDSLNLVPSTPRIIKRLKSWVQRLENRYLQRSRAMHVLAVSMAALGLFAAVSALGSLIPLLLPIESSQLFRGVSDRIAIENYTWFIALHILQIIVGLALLGGCLLLLKKNERLGIILGYYSLLIYLTVVDLLLFYYYQFSTIIMALIQFALLMGLNYYRNRYQV